MKPITVWFKKNDDGKFDYNHFEDGHVTAEHPTPLHESHKKAWARGHWKSEHAYLNGESPPVLFRQVTVDDIDELDRLARVLTSAMNWWKSVSPHSVGHSRFKREYYKAEADYTFAISQLKSRVEFYQQFSLTPT